jgi:Cu/Ag efflux protein CusF
MRLRAKIGGGFRNLGARRSFSHERRGRQLPVARQSPTRREILEMRKLLIMSAALAAGALALPAVAAQQSQQSSANQQTTADPGTKVTGMVTEADKDTQQITINGQTFHMEHGGGAAMFPNIGDEVTLYYEERNGQKTVTRIGQPQKGAAAQAGQQNSGNQQTAADEGNKVTGTVTNVDQNKQEITIDDQTYQMLLGAGAGLEPQVGAKVTAYYEDRNGKKTITRIGQAE